MRVRLIQKMYARTYQAILRGAALFLPWEGPKLHEVSSTQETAQVILQLLRAKQLERVLFVTSPGLDEIALPHPLLDALRAEGIFVSYYPDAPSNPTVPKAEEALQQYHRDGCQALIAFGGGSPIDLTKAVGARLAKPKRSLAQMRGVLKIRKSLPLFIAIPTTAGSGSETTLAAVLTDPEHGTKFAINDPSLFPDHAILNPETTTALPRFFTATTGLDALTHALEAYIGRSTTAETRALSEEAVSLILTHLLTACIEPSDLKARAGMQRAAFVAGRAFTRSYVGYVHALSHAISAKYNTPHGLANSVLLPHVLRAFGSAIEPQLAKLARLNHLAEAETPEDVAATAFLRTLKKLYRDLEIPATLEELCEADLPELVSHAVHEAYPLYPVPVLLSATALESILRRALPPQSPPTIDEALEAARTAFDEGMLHTRQARLQILKRLQEVIEANIEPICSALHADLNKSYAESYMTEISIVLEEIRYMRRHLRSFMKPKRCRISLSQFPATQKLRPEPYGVALILGPWNYPFQLALTPLVDAIAAGNTALIKPSAYSPHVSALIRRICSQAFEPGLVHVIEGGRKENQELLQKRFDVIFFTGSPTVGHHVMEAAAHHLTPVTLELGGKSPALVDETANIEETARRLIFGKVANSGQTCVAPDYVYVHESVQKSLIEALLRQLPQTLPSRAYCDQNYGKIINTKHYDRLCSLLQGQNCLLPAYFAEESDAPLTSPCNPKTRQIYPVLIDNPSWNSPIMQEEIFGPLLPILTYSKSGELFSLLRKQEKPLALYLFSKNPAFVQKAVQEVSSGGVCINDTLLHLASSHAPFGGVGQSGMGNYHGRAGFDTFSHHRTILRRFWILDMPLRHHPYRSSTLKWIRRLLSFGTKKG